MTKHCQACVRDKPGPLPVGQAVPRERTDNAAAARQALPAYRQAGDRPPQACNNPPPSRPSLRSQHSTPSRPADILRDLLLKVPVQRIDAAQETRPVMARPQRLNDEWRRHQSDSRISREWVFFARFIAGDNAGGSSRRSTKRCCSSIERLRSPADRWATPLKTLRGMFGAAMPLMRHPV